MGKNVLDKSAPEGRGEVLITVLKGDLAANPACQLLWDLRSGCLCQSPGRLRESPHLERWKGTG